MNFNGVRDSNLTREENEKSIDKSIGNQFNENR